MPKIKYQFDSKTLTFKKVKLVWKQIIQRIVLFVLVTGISAVAVNLIYTSFYKTPKVIKLEEKGEILLSKYDGLNKRMQDINLVVNDMQLRDDYFYRSIFELGPIPPSVREAGFGGVNHYVDLEGYNNSEVLIETFKKVDKVSKKIYVQSKSFDTVIELAKNKERMIACVPAIQPVAIKDFTRISDYFGSRSDPFTGKPTMHHGMDFTGPEGSDIFVTGDGIVVEAGYSIYGYGNRIVVDHGYGFKTVYAHLKKIVVEEGQKLKRGEVIGLLGNTGRSTGAHLHYEVKLHGITIDPINYYFNDISAEEYELMVIACSKRRIPMD